jgi:hypothetical protein
MARSSPETQAKRRRELAKKDKRREKDEKRALRKQQRTDTDAPAPADPLSTGNTGPRTTPTSTSLSTNPAIVAWKRRFQR